MTGYAMGLMGTERLRELRREASGGLRIPGRRIAAAGDDPEAAKVGRARLTLRIVRRIARLGGAA